MVLHGKTAWAKLRKRLCLENLERVLFSVFCFLCSKPDSMLLKVTIQRAFSTYIDPDDVQV